MARKNIGSLLPTQNFEESKRGLCISDGDESQGGIFGSEVLGPDFDLNSFANVDRPEGNNAQPNELRKYDQSPQILNI